MNQGTKFSFGRNWQRYLDEMPAGAKDRMADYVAGWLRPLDGLRDDVLR